MSSTPAARIAISVLSMPDKTCTSPRRKQQHSPAITRKARSNPRHHRLTLRPPASARAGSSSMMRRRSVLVIADQRAISSSERRQPQAQTRCAIDLAHVDARGLHRASSSLSSAAGIPARIIGRICSVGAVAAQCAGAASLRLAASSPAAPSAFGPQARRPRGPRRHLPEPVRFLAKRLQRRHGAQHAMPGRDTIGVGALAQLGAQLEGAAVQLDQVLHDGSPSPVAALGRLVGQRALTERLHARGGSPPWGCRGRYRVRSASGRRPRSCRRRSA